MKKIRIITPRNIEVLLFIYDNGGEVIGFREMSQTLRKGYGTIRDALKDLEYNGLIEKDVVRGVVGKYRLTPKGKKAAEIIKDLVRVLEE